MMRLFLLALLAVGSLFGQLQLYSFDGVKETPLPALFDAGSAAVGDSIEIRIRVRNLGASAVTLQTVTASGAAFALTAQPLLPSTLAPGGTADFRVGFKPSSAGIYSAVVAANGVSGILRATAVIVAELTQSISGSRVVVPGGATIDLGRIQRGASSTQSMFLRNPGTTPLRVGGVSASGDGFASSVGPITIAAGQSVEFAIVFSPARAGEYAGTLSVDQRIFALRGTGFDPPLPSPSIVIDSSSLGSGEQHQVSLRFDAPAPVSGTGTLQLIFESAVTMAPNDPLVQFVKAASRSASFTVSAGETQARFGTDSWVVFQTGTTAGVVRFRVAIAGQPANSVERIVTLGPLPIAIDTASATRQIDGLFLLFTGFDNTYSAGAATFTFYDGSGNAIAPGAIRADFTSEFKTYFAASPLGSAFQMRVSFPVAGDASKIAAVEAELMNAAGAKKTQRIAFP